MPSVDQAQPAVARACGAACIAGALEGTISGLVVGTVYGVIKEKKFILQNVVKDYHQRDPPLQLFSVMVRGITAAAVFAVFGGVFRATECCCRPALQQATPPVGAGVAGTFAAAFNMVIHQERLHAPTVVQRSLVSGTFAAATVGAGQLLFDQNHKSRTGR